MSKVVFMSMAQDKVGFLILTRSIVTFLILSEESKGGIYMRQGISTVVGVGEHIYTPGVHVYYVKNALIFSARRGISIHDVGLRISI